MADLSVIIAARNEMWLGHTVADVLAHATGDTEVIVILDGAWPETPLPIDPRLKVIYHPISIGQRAAVNEGARLSNARYIMKLDAHCAVAPGFDTALMADCQPDWTVIPRMYNLHVFDWRCTVCGHTQYQGPTPGLCECGGSYTRDIKWQPRWNRQTDFARFDHNLHFQYWGAYKDREAAQPDIADVMSSVGACWFMERDRFWQLGGLDEAHGSWGQMGVEIACKSWLSGGRQVVNKKTWFSHLFRTQGGDFGHPYPITASDVDKARSYSQDLWTNNKWPGQIHPFSWLIAKFQPVPDWPEGTVTKACVYYTDNLLDPDIMIACQQSIERGGLPIHSVSLQPLTWGQNIVVPAQRSPLTMFRQILAGLEASTADVIFLTEHDVLYHPSHFTFTPPNPSTIYYNINVWKVDSATGHAVKVDDCRQTSGLCANRSLLIAHYRERIQQCEQHGFSRAMGFEPGTKSIRRGGVDNLPSATWSSAQPNLDIRHTSNLTPTRWNRDQFRNQRYTQGWTETDNVPGWTLHVE